jgi:hypothetical protein
VKITRHAFKAWRRRATSLNIEPSESNLIKTIKKASPENTKNRAARWNLFKRGVLNGSTVYLVRDGWRFIVADRTLVTVERIRPNENYIDISLN